jgi:two-component system, NarL family, response regulator
MTNQIPPIRILIADDHPVVRSGIVATLEIDSEANLHVVGQAENGREMVELFAQLQPDIGLVDLRMPEMTGVEAIVQIRSQFPEARLIILTTYDEDEDIYQGLQAGAKTCLLKKTRREELLECIQNVHSGRPSLPPDLFKKFLDWQKNQEDLKNIKLTERELEVLQLIAKGMSNAEIGTTLQIVEGTVKSHVNSILSKLDVKDRTQAVIVALKRGLIRLD